MRYIMKDIIGHEGLYTIDDNGFIYNIKGIRLYGAKNSDGYIGISLQTRDGKRKGYLYHRLVCMNFHDNPDNLPHVDHIDGIRDNNHPSNLQWISARGNVDKAKNIVRELVTLLNINTGEEVTIDCAYSFATSNNLSKEAIRKLVNGSQKKYQDWVKI